MNVPIHDTDTIHTVALRQVCAERDALRAALEAVLEAGRMSDQNRAVYCADIARASLAKVQS